ncbi:MAG: HDOD domain-containing protein [Candidatus Krumholzibacteriota bacterium]|nr:HDOD domain-containing protein [Candidatus Krumholzibacteriota bacterium]
MRNKIDEMFTNVKNLPSLPLVVQKIFASINDSSVGAKHLAKIITSDQTLTARVLKLANSSFFGLRGKVQNIHHAVTMLGFSTIRQICLGVSICGKFKDTRTPPGFSGTAFWTHSIVTAILAKEIARGSVRIEPDICYTIGLIHDIGKLLLLDHHQDKFIEALNLAHVKNIPLVEAETRILEVNHADVGSWLLRKWNLPRESRQAVRNHHEAEMQTISPISNDALTGIIYFANQLAHHLELGNSGTPPMKLDEQNFKKFFGSTPREMRIDKVRIEEETQVSIEILGLSQPAESPV